MTLRATIITVAVLGIVSVAVADVTYTITDLGTLGGNNAAAWGVNSSGRVAGSDWLSDGSTGRGFYWKAGVMTDIGALSGHTQSCAYDINTSSTVVGSSQSTPYDQESVVWTEGGGIQPINAFLSESNRWSFGAAINDSGHVAGTSGVDDGWYHAYFWDGATTHDVGVLSGMSYSWGVGINASDTVVGRSGAGLSYRAFVWTEGGGISQLPTLGGNSVANAINAAGVIVGTSATAGNDRAVMWTWNGTGYDITDLGTLGGTYSCALGISATGDVVGYSERSDSMISPFLKRSNMPIIDLNDQIPPSEGWWMTSATDINSAGQMVGYGNHLGLARAFLMSPVPEPVAMSLLMLGSLAVIRRRR